MSTHHKGKHISNIRSLTNVYENQGRVESQALKVTNFQSRVSVVTTVPVNYRRHLKGSFSYESTENNTFNGRNLNKGELS